MKPGNNNTSLLPGEGWKDILNPQRFVASIQLFLKDLFGINRGPITFMYRYLVILRLHLEFIILAQACPSINRRSFSVAIIQKAQELWINLLHWEEYAIHIPLFYHQSQQRPRITEVTPFHNYHTSGNIVNSTLSDSVFGVEKWFPSGVIALINAFCNTIPHSWSHIFATTTTRETYY